MGKFGNFQNNLIIQKIPLKWLYSLDGILVYTST